MSDTVTMENLKEKSWSWVKQIVEKQHLFKNYSAQREKHISSCFQKTVDFKYPQTIDEFDMHLTFFQRKRNVNKWK